MKIIIVGFVPIFYSLEKYVYVSTASTNSNNFYDRDIGAMGFASDGLVRHTQSIRHRRALPEFRI